ncbi:MAG: TIGR00725 family protein [Deltaproteobacteria bacterium]
MKIAIGVIGIAKASPEELSTAEEVGSEIAKRGCVLISGGLGGVMLAACRGAKSQGGITVGIIPGGSKAGANRYVDIPVVTAMSHARNVIIVRSCDALVAVGGSWGTLSEIAFAMKLRIPVVGIKTWEVSSDIKMAQTPEEAVDLAYSLACARRGSSLLD